MASCVKFLVPKSWHRQRVTELETTTSTCATEAVRRKHVFEIKGYRGLLSRTGGAGESVRSAAFAVGGYDWTVLYYPRGCGAHALSGHVSVFVELMTPGAEAWASCELSLVPRSIGARAHKVSTGSCLFRRGDGDGDSNGSAAWRGWCSFMERTKLEVPADLRDDTIRIKCTVTVFKERAAANSGTRKVAAPPAADRVVQVPPSELSSDLAKLLQDSNNNGAPPPPLDITLVVDL